MPNEDRSGDEAVKQWESLIRENDEKIETRRIQAPKRSSSAFEIVHVSGRIGGKRITN